MEYSHLLNRAWTIVWTHRFLLLLGMLAALGGGGGGNNIRWQMGDGNGRGSAIFNFGDGAFAGFSIALLVFFIAIALAIALVLWVLATVARGGLIAAVDTIERGGPSSLRTAWITSWQKVWSLLGIALLPAIPILILVVAGVVMAGALAGFAAFTRMGFELALRAGILIPLVGLACIAAPFALALALLRNFAERACILEDLGVFPAYRRGWEVLTHNLGPAIILFLIQIVLLVVLGIGFIGPGIVMALCFLLWPLLLLISGMVEAYFSSLWTLAWREWTARSTSGPLTPYVAEG
jgi:hypothetical protein